MAYLRDMVRLRVATGRLLKSSGMIENVPNPTGGVDFIC